MDRHCNLGLYSGA